MLLNRTLRLFYAFIRRRERKLAGGGTSWPIPDYKFVRRGIVYEKQPVQLRTARSTGEYDLDDVDVMGDAFWSLPMWKCVVLWTWGTIEATDKGLAEWRNWKNKIGLSERQLRSILLDLQDAAEAKGLQLEKIPE